MNSLQFVFSLILLITIVDVYTLFYALYNFIYHYYSVCVLPHHFERVLQMLDVRMVDDETPVKFAKDVVFTVDKYEIV